MPMMGILPNSASVARRSDASGILSELVNEVLDMSKLESGEVKLDLQPPTLLKSSRRFARSWNIKPRNSV